VRYSGDKEDEEKKIDLMGQAKGIESGRGGIGKNNTCQKKNWEAPKKGLSTVDQKDH